jgi:hypothetical protein
MTYSELVDAIRSYSEVGDNVFTPTVVNNFILMAENRVMRDVDLDAFKEYDIASLSSTNNLVELPPGLLFVQYIQVIPTSGERYFLEQRDSSFMNEYIPNNNDTSNSPKYYALWDSTTMQLAPAPAASGGSLIQLEMGYFKRAPQLSVETSQTWMSINAPEVLFYACMVEAMSYTKGPDNMMAYYNQRYSDSAQKLSFEQMGRSRRDEYRDGVLRFPLASKSP